MQTYTSKPARATPNTKRVQTLSRKAVLKRPRTRERRHRSYRPVQHPRAHTAAPRRGGGRAQVAKPLEGRARPGLHRVSSGESAALSPRLIGQIRLNGPARGRHLFQHGRRRHPARRRPGGVVDCAGAGGPGKLNLLCDTLRGEVSRRVPPFERHFQDVRRNFFPELFRGGGAFGVKERR